MNETNVEALVSGPRKTTKYDFKTKKEQLRKYFLVRELRQCVVSLG